MTARSSMPSSLALVGADATILRDVRPLQQTLVADLVLSSGEVLSRAQALLLTQSQAIAALAGRLDHRFSDAVDVIRHRRGRLVVCGMGKSGLVGRKIAATMSSTGTPSFFLHASEALHGDLGMVTTEDTVLMISNSGETEEVLKVLPTLVEMDVPVIGMAGNENCTLARRASVFLNIGVDREACPLNLAPTTSTLVTLALGDALAMALSLAKGFQETDFARFHPGGALGRRLCSRVRDIMRTEPLPTMRPEQSMREAVMIMTEGRCGLAAVVEGTKVVGVITDGDLRRAFQNSEKVFEMCARDVMTKNPIVIPQDAMLSEAEEMMLNYRVKALLAVDQDQTLRGIVEIFSR